jgi:Bardet-Biedl syndrome 7 protein
VFKTPPGGGPVTALALGGLVSAGLKRERIFYAQGQKVTGLNKKGKDFFKLTSSLTENINHMAVEETRIWTGACIEHT